jgi:GNAT superfamily N-acetyltransferase
MSTALNLLVREARPEELETAFELTVAAYRQYEESLGAFWNQYVSNIQSQWLGEANNQRIIAASGDRVVGGVLLYPPQEGLYEKLQDTIPYPEFRLLGVHPGIRGQGIATALIQECVQRAARLHAPFLGLHTTYRMPEAIRLYQKLGFERSPQYDFPAADGITIVEAYRIALNETKV